ncbi:hypothetical protein OTU49_007624 [Cherax quadricarinatus]|uniref:Uncharacterized protein n=2 Tax=Cherax quadricarinatus TaxID=27406 RepID=A0AAW0YBQ0_CHEQU
MVVGCDKALLTAPLKIDVESPRGGALRKMDCGKIRTLRSKTSRQENQIRPLKYVKTFMERVPQSPTDVASLGRYGKVEDSAEMGPVPFISFPEEDPILISKKNSRVSETSSTLLESDSEDPLDLKVVDSLLVFEKDPLSLKITGTQMVVNKHLHVINDAVPILESEDNKLELKTSVSQLVSQDDDPLETEKSLPEFIKQDNPLELEKSVYQLVYYDDPLETAKSLY